MSGGDLGGRVGQFSVTKNTGLWRVVFIGDENRDKIPRKKNCTYLNGECDGRRKI